MGLVLVKTHRILEFEQSKWLKQYIDFNTEKRKAAASAFEKDLFKLMNNSVYGKTLQNTRKYKDIRIVMDEQRAKRFIARPTFRHSTIINDNVTVISLTKAEAVLNKPIYVGMCILDISKLQMYQFHYKHIVPLYGDRARLLFTDTDSLCYDIQTDDVYADMSLNLSEYDTSDYPKGHPLYSPVNAKVIGKFKDETHGVAPLEFVGLRSKMYSLLLPDAKEKKTAKGVKRSFVAKCIRHADYRRCLFDKQTTTAVFHNIGSHAHTLHTTKYRKSALSPYDDKRYLLTASKSYAYGHFCIPH